MWGNPVLVIFQPGALDPPYFQSSDDLKFIWEGRDNLAPENDTRSLGRAQCIPCMSSSAPFGGGHYIIEGDESL
ncbi:unnamed protein product [Arctogadus glacialis]